MADTVKLIARVYRPDAFPHNKKFKSLELVDGPPHVMRFFDSRVELRNNDGMELIQDLAMAGYEIKIEAEYVSVSVVEFANDATVVQGHREALEAIYNDADAFLDGGMLASADDLIAAFRDTASEALSPGSLAEDTSRQ